MDTPLFPKAPSWALPAPYKTFPPFMGNVLAWIRRFPSIWNPRVCPRLLTLWHSCMLTVAPSLRRQLRRRRRSPWPQVALAPSWHPLQPADTKQRVHCCSSALQPTQSHTTTERLGRDPKDCVASIPCCGRDTCPWPGSSKPHPGWLWSPEHGRYPHPQQHLPTSGHPTAKNNPPHKRKLFSEPGKPQRRQVLSAVPYHIPWWHRYIRVHMLNTDKGYQLNPLGTGTRLCCLK